MANHVWFRVLGLACFLSGVSGFRSSITARSSSRRVVMRAESETRRTAIKRVATGAAAAAAASGGAVPWANAVVKIDPDSVKTTKGGCKFVVVKEGSCPAADPTGLAGSCYVGRASFIILDYTAFLPNGSVFDTTEKKDGKPLAFKMGQKQVIPGIEEVVAYMLPGEEVQALIPAALAYGEKGVCTPEGDCLIPPNTNLKYYMKLRRVAAAPA